MQTVLPVGTYLLATATLWAVSAAIAVTAGLLLAMASLSRPASARLLADAIITLGRGIPTSLVVVAAGIVSSRLPPATWMPNIFPGTQSGLQTLAWAVTLAVALGSAGHLAVIFRTAYLAVGKYRIEQARAMGLMPLPRLAVLGREAAPLAIPPTSARLVHHLHNTAFAALFPVADLFGWVQERASTTFDVTTYALIGAALYVMLSGAIWLSGHVLELRLAVVPKARSRVGRPAA